ncbi:MAG: DUF1573 domain-containing protein [Cyclobacteriaceae bacterium]|nr:DUF1573 domain-containing protein [Cyclobacteriaceae bacterium]
MAKLFSLMLFLALSTTGLAQQAGAVISWEKATHDFGDIVQGEKVEHTFKFKNAGTEPLIITNVQVTCGCTTPKGWTRDPILPGESSEITIGFNSAGKYSRQEKVITVVSNAVNPEGAQIVFSANVLEKKIPN